MQNYKIWSKVEGRNKENLTVGNRRRGAKIVLSFSSQNSLIFARGTLKKL